MTRMQSHDWRQVPELLDEKFSRDDLAVGVWIEHDGQGMMTGDNGDRIQDLARGFGWAGHLVTWDNIVDDYYDGGCYDEDVYTSAMESAIDFLNFIAPSGHQVGIDGSGNFGMSEGPIPEDLLDEYGTVPCKKMERIVYSDMPDNWFSTQN